MDNVTATIEYLQTQITELKEQLAKHSNCDYWKAENGRVQSQIIDLINDAYDSESDSEDILTTLCEIIDYNPTKTITFEAVVHFSGAIDVPRSEQADFSLDEALADVYVDINDGNIVIDNYELYEVYES